MTETQPCMAQPAISEDDAYAIGIDAYTYAYPMVLMEMTRRISTNAAAPDEVAQHAPMNQFVHMPRLVDATFTDVVRPNADTLYSLLWYDVGQEPLIVSTPTVADRYFVLPIMDLWTDVFATLGTRTTGHQGIEFALVGPRWQGTLPAGMRKIVSPTDVGWMIGRTQVNGPADLPAVRDIQRQLKAAPLSRHGRPDAPPDGRPGSAVDAAIDMRTPPVDQTANLDPAAFFSIFAELLDRNPPHAADYAMLLRMERIGLVPGKRFDFAGADPAVRRALMRAAPDAYQRMIAQGRALRIVRDGWSKSASMIGIYGSDYLTRAYVAFRGLGALPPDEAVYPSLVADGDNQPLTGASRYVLHFDAGQTPPVDAFWSLTMYGPDQFFVDNPIDRYAIGDRDALAFNADGSLDLYIQHDSPGKDHEPNWLPAPTGPLDMTMRLYLPRAQASDGRWQLPKLKRLP
ncbi:DUF1254 domain-containing protein [Burkholderia guangdongensis]|uniref:DUF1254 domain-containing protein n=1 Tax=Burkholderia guangdongensis TaxID=1792500 RepID=UPI001FE5E5EA|nr:DUF1254 domain-containing protein [Burkholderia guangdongensis]